jgi:hypothetical protein
MEYGAGMMKLPEMSREEMIAYDAICNAADTNQPCPLNMDIEDMLGFNSTSMGPKMISRLEQKGLIVVRRFQRFREVQIVATGKWTRRSDMMQTFNAHVPRGAGSRSPAPSDRKPYRMGLR